MRKEKGERAGALMSRMVISPFSFLLSPLIPLRGLFLPVRSTATVSLCPPYL